MAIFWETSVKMRVRQTGRGSSDVILPGKYSALLFKDDKVLLGVKSMWPFDSALVELQKVTIAMSDYRPFLSANSVLLTAAGIGLAFFNEPLLGLGAATVVSTCAALLGQGEPSDFRWTVFRTR
jgi:hypothetical protein